MQFPGAIYHVSCRMVGDWRTRRAYLFRDEAGRERFVNRLAERVAAYNIRPNLLDCTTNRFHQVFETPEANCAKFMQSLSMAYTVYYNPPHGRYGHLLYGRYNAKPVEGDEYLLAPCRYVHLNSVCVGSMQSRGMEERSKAMRAHRWASYSSFIGLCQALDFVEYGPLLAETSGRGRARAKRYGELVESGLAGTDEDFEMALRRSPRSFGSGSAVGNP